MIGGIIVAVIVGTLSTVKLYVWDNSAADPVSSLPATLPYFQGGDNVVVADFHSFFDRSGNPKHPNVSTFTILPAKKVRWQVVRSSPESDNLEFNVATVGILGATDVLLHVKDGMVTDAMQGKTLRISRVSSDYSTDDIYVVFRVYRVD